MTNEISQSRIREETADFYKQIVPFGYADVERAIEVALEVGYDGNWAGEQVTEFMNDTQSSLDNVDPVDIVYESILQEARTTIDDAIDYDFVNDLTQGTEIYTYGNALATSYDYSEEAIEELQKKLKESTLEEVDRIKENKATVWFLEQIDIEI